jgi:MFS family permease
MDFPVKILFYCYLLLGFSLFHLPCRKFRQIPYDGYLWQRKIPMEFSLQRNLGALYIIRIAKWLNLVMPVIVLFYQSNGLSMQDIFTLKAIYSVALMFLEIPTGYFADVAGRRTSLFLGSLLGFGGYLIYTSSAGFWQFVVAEIVLGAGMSLVSGADSAMLYDTLIAVGKQKRYTRYEGRITSYGNFAEAFAGIAGGLLAASSLVLPFYFQACVSFVAIPAAMVLKEPPVHAPIRKTGFKDIWSVITLVFHGDRRLFWNTMFSAMTGVSTLTMAWFAQPWMILAGLKVGFFGVAWAALNLTTGLASLFAWKVEKVLGMKRITVTFTSVMLMCWFGLAINSMTGFTGNRAILITAGFSLLLLFYFSRGLATPTLRNYINLITSSDIRATVLSVRNFIIRGLFAVLGPFFGWLSDQASLAVAFTASGGVFVLLTVTALLFFLRTNSPGK